MASCFCHHPDMTSSQHQYVELKVFLGLLTFTLALSCDSSTGERTQNGQDRVEKKKLLRLSVHLIYAETSPRFFS